jgi:hypothetical protein
MSKTGAAILAGVRANPLGREYFQGVRFTRAARALASAGVVVLTPAGEWIERRTRAGNYRREYVPGVVVRLA